MVPDGLANNSTDLSQGGSGLVIDTTDAQISDAISPDGFTDTVIRMVNFFIGFLGLAATLAIIYAGVLWVVSAGNEDSVTKAKKIITYAALGIIVVILSFSIVRFIAGSAGGGGSNGGGTGTIPGTGGQCQNDSDCPAGEICAISNTNSGERICVLRSGGNGDVCQSNADCQLNQVCNTSTERCELENRPGVTGTPAEPAVNENLDEIDDLLDGLDQDLDISRLDTADKTAIETILANRNNIDDKISSLEDMIDDPNTSESVRRRLEAFVAGLERLKLIRLALDDARDVMPESADLIELYNETSDNLDALMDDPSNGVLYRRFESKYRAFKELVQEFPVVQARIRALPGEGNVPFSVQLDGLDSIDPTGGTISQYRWSFIDNGGREVSLNSEPVILHEFTEANTYVVKLRASTSQVDEQGYKTAMDGISTVRVRANPPASQVKFRINGVETLDVFHATMKEAEAGLTFDPSITVPALGRQITKYEWFFGDGATDVRNVPTAVVHTYRDPGEYFVKLITTDSLQQKDTRVVKLFIKSVAASVRVNPLEGNVNTTFTISGLDSRSDDGIIDGYEWEIQNEEGRTVYETEERTFDYRFDRPGDYKIILVVTDLTNNRDTVIETVSVRSRPPVANFDFSTPEANHPNRLRFNAINSYDPDEGDQITYSWDFNNDGDYEVVGSPDTELLHTYERPGSYRAVLQVEDAFGERDSFEKVIEIKQVLSADLVADRFTARVGEPITFKADSENAVGYLWEFGDGNTTTTDEIEVEHTYTQAGRYQVVMNFFDRDDNGLKDTAQVLVGSTDEPLAMPEFTINGDKPERYLEDLCGDNKNGLVVTRADRLRLNADRSVNADGTGRLLTYSWEFPDGQKSANKQIQYKFESVNEGQECSEIKLTVRDDITGRLSQEAILYFRVVNQLPSVTDFVYETNDLESDDLITPLNVRLTLINPTDEDGTVKKYRWWYTREGFDDEKFGLHTTSVPQTDLVITSFGDDGETNRYFFWAEVIDSDGGVYETAERFSETNYFDVINGPNLSPIADFSMDKTIISVGDSVTFVSHAYDPQGETLPNDAYRWDFDGDGSFDDTTSGPQLNRQYNTPGEYTVRLRVVHRGLSTSVEKTLMVEPSNSLPQAAFTYTIKDNDVVFDAGTTRFDPDLEDTTLRFEWDFDVESDADGNGINDDDVESTEMRPTHAYAATDVYRVKLTAKDALGMEGVVVRDVDLNQSEEDRLESMYQSLRVSAPQHAITALDVDLLPAQLRVGRSADLTVRILNADGSEYNGEVYFDVLEGSGEFTPNPVMAKQSVAQSIFRATGPGEVRIRVRVPATLFGELSEEIILTVEP